jgi:hypothetical protein
MVLSPFDLFAASPRPASVLFRGYHTGKFPVLQLPRGGGSDLFRLMREELEKHKNAASVD